MMIVPWRVHHSTADVNRWSHSLWPALSLPLHVGAREGIEQRGVGNIDRAISAATVPEEENNASSPTRPY